MFPFKMVDLSSSLCKRLPEGKWEGWSTTVPWCLPFISFPWLSMAAESPWVPAPSSSDPLEKPLPHCSPAPWCRPPRWKDAGPGTIAATSSAMADGERSNLCHPDPAYECLWFIWFMMKWMKIQIQQNGVPEESRGCQWSRGDSLRSSTARGR